MKEVEFVIDEKGNVKIDVHGVKDKKCLDLTRDIEEALGKVKKREFKREARLGRNEGLSVKRK